MNDDDHNWWLTEGRALQDRLLHALDEGEEVTVIAPDGSRCILSRWV